MSERMVKTAGAVVFDFPRRWWQLYRSGWYPHVTGMGEKCWIRFKWDQQHENATASISRLTERNAELEAECERLIFGLKHIARHFGSAEQCREIANNALDAKPVCKVTTTAKCLCWRNLHKNEKQRADKAEATIKRVEGLLAEWEITSDPSLDFPDCRRQLQQALNAPETA